MYSVGPCILGNARTHVNRKLTIQGISYINILNKGACTVENALTRENGKLTEQDISDNNISSEGSRTLDNVPGAQTPNFFTCPNRNAWT